MGEPVKIHTDHTTLDSFEKAPETLPQKPIIADEPLKSFTLLHDTLQTRLSGWMMQAPERREKAVKEWAAAKDKNLRAEVLLFIIWYEAFHPGGSSKVAALAFKALFPDHLRDAR